ncbi:MAG: cbb3-type cytochrome c oxidase subunit II, partial [Anaerolineae bacterium]
ALAAPRDLAPELLPAWLADVAQAANALAAIAAVFLAVALFGTFVGRERRPSAPPTDVGASEPGPSGVATMFVVAGLAVVLAQVLAQAAQGPISLRITQFTAWDQVAGLTPVLPGLTLVAIGAGYSLAAVPGAAYQVRPRVHFYTAVAAAILLITPLWAIGLAEAAIGPDGGIMRLRAAASAPGVALLLVSAAMWLLSMARALRRPAGDSPVSQPRESAAVRGSGGPAPAEPLRAPELARREPGTAAVVAPAGPGPSAPAVVGTAATLIVIALFVTLFLPLVDSGYSAATDRAGDRYLEPGSLAEQGRRIYVADGCAACHTQRVRPYPEDVVYGPVTEIGDFEYGPPLVGNRRAGPDLTWIGDRRVGREQMTEGLGAHGPDGVPAMPWLMSSEAATTRDGGIVVDYLMRLRSPTGPAPGADGS